MALSLKLPSTLPIARYRFEFKVTEDLLLPEYSGSTLRGIWGHALRLITCMTKAKSCDLCPLLTTCPYPEIFESPVPENGIFAKMQNIPQGYIIEPPDIGARFFTKGEILNFDMVLLGHVIERIALINYAWQRAFKRGVGKWRGRAEFIDIKVEGQDGFHSILAGQYIAPHIKSIDLPTFDTSTVTLKLLTPLRLQERGRIVSPDKIRTDLFFIQLLRRFSMVSSVYFSHSVEADYVQLKLLAEQITTQAKLYWYDWARYSNRQQKKVPLGGILGEWTFYDLPEPFIQLLYLGQWLHAGKNTTFGLGRYELLSRN